jgi:hypothetical protein
MNPDREGAAAGESAPLRDGRVHLDPGVGEPTLPPIGRALVAGLVLAGAVVGAWSGLGLFWFIPFGGVGALLAVRRPRTSIGWILMALGWSFALSSATVNATVEQFVGRTLDWPTAFYAVLVFAAPGLIFYLLSVLTLAFPTGRLPGGRWTWPVRVALGAGFALVLVTVFSPNLLLTLEGGTASVAVPNPVALAPDLPIWKVLAPERAIFPLLFLLAASVLSLVVRFRRAAGIERQQLRWFGAALVFVVLAVMVGLIVSSWIPGSSESGYAWYPAIAAFPTVPVAIGIAVLRYRLYEIDTIINRAIVYGLLTAILAGTSAAAIAVGQRLFTGIVGAGSDATIVLTTLIVVSAFNPAKARLQAIVDRRFKEVHDPVADLEAFTAGVRGSLARPDRGRTLRTFLEVAVAALAASGGELTTTGPGALPMTLRSGTPSDEGVMVVTAAMDSDSVELRLSGVTSPRAADALDAALRAVLEETEPIA